MPTGGVEGELEVAPEHEAALTGIEGASHLVVVGWLDQGETQEAGSKTTKPGPPDEEERGVFATRSPGRPNPLGWSVVALLGRQGRRLRVADLDLVDGTPVLDLKPYSPAWDSVFSAHTPHDLAPRPRAPERELPRLIHAGAAFHGERCPRVALAARLVYHLWTQWEVPPREPNLVITVGEDGHLADALQGITGARLGSWRLFLSRGRGFRLRHGDREVVATLKADGDLSEDAILKAAISDLFVLVERRVA